MAVEYWRRSFPALAGWAAVVPGGENFSAGKIPDGLGHDDERHGVARAENGAGGDIARIMHAAINAGKSHGRPNGSMNHTLRR